MSGSGRVQFVLTADGQRMEQAMQRLIARTEKLEAANKKLKDSINTGFDQNERKQKSFFDGAVSGAKSFVQSYLGPGMMIAAVQQLNAAMADQIELQKKSREATVTLGGARRDLLKLLADEPKHVQDKFTSLAPEAIRSGVVTQYGEAQLTQMIANATSKTSGEHTRRIQQVRNLMPLLDIFRSRDPDETTDFMEAGVTFSGMLGAGNPEWGDKLAEEVSKQGFGTMATIVSQSALSELSGTRYLARALGSAINASEEGLDHTLGPRGIANQRLAQARSAGALFTVMGQNVPTESGRMTSTDTAAVIDSLANLMPTEEFIKDGRSYLPKFDKFGQMIDTTSERIAVMAGQLQAFNAAGEAIPQAELRKDYIRHFAAGSTASHKAVEQMFTPGSYLNRQLVEVGEVINRKSYDDVVKDVDRLRQVQMEDPFIRQTIMDERRESRAERAKLERKQSAYIDVVREEAFGEGGIYDVARKEGAFWSAKSQKQLARTAWEAAVMAGEDPMQALQHTMMLQQAGGRAQKKMIDSGLILGSPQRAFDTQKLEEGLHRLHLDLEHQTGVFRRNTSGQAAGAVGSAESR